METSEFRSFPEMENIGNSGVSGNRVTSKYTYLGNSPEFRVVLEPWERILTVTTLNTNTYRPVILNDEPSSRID